MFVEQISLKEKDNIFIWSRAQICLLYSTIKTMSTSGAKVEHVCLKSFIRSGFIKLRIFKLCNKSTTCLASTWTYICMIPIGFERLEWLMGIWNTDTSCAMSNSLLSLIHFCVSCQHAWNYGGHFEILTDLKQSLYSEEELGQLKNHFQRLDATFTNF